MVGKNEEESLLGEGVFSAADVALGMADLAF
jgi:hypothetical protein